MNGKSRVRLERGVALVTVALAICAGGAAFAQDPATPPPAGPPPVGGTVGYFGERGQFVVSGDFKFSVMRQSTSMGGDTYTTYEIQPAVDYFISPNVSVGGLVGIRKEPITTDISLTTITIGPRVGYNLYLTNAVTLWVRAGLGYAHYSVSGAGNADASGYSIPLSLYAPVLWHPTTHFFIGAGLFLETDLISKIDGENAGKTTNFGLSSTVGGYFGGL